MRRASSGLVQKGDWIQQVIENPGSEDQIDLPGRVKRFGEITEFEASLQPEGVLQYQAAEERICIAFDRHHVGAREF